MRFIRAFLVLLLGLLVVVPVGSAQAVQGGESALGDQRVVALVVGANTRASCSGAPINPYVVVAAAHCLSNPNYTYSSEYYLPKDLIVALPGVDLTKDGQATRARVLQVAITPGFNESSAADDLAFYFVDRAIIQSGSLPLANLDELAQVKSSGGKVTHLGYGYIQPNYVEDYRPHKIVLGANAQSISRFGLFAPAEGVTISTDESKGFALCKHDSGGPFVASLGGVEKLLAINLFADGCDRNGPNTVIKGSLGLSPVPYLDLLSRQWSAFKAAHPELRGIDSADAQLKAWVKAGTPEVKATASASPSPSASPLVVKKVNVISCIKGKVAKKVSGIDPKCPKGFVLKR